MKIVAFAASNSRNSINKILVNYVLQSFPGNITELLDLNDYEMPIYSIDRENETGIPDKAKEFAAKIDNADIIIISFAEHNGTYSVAFKNIFDWISRIKGRTAFGNKPIFVMAASSGKRGGKSVLEAATKRFPFNGGEVLTCFSLPYFSKNFHIERGILEEDKKNELNAKIEFVKEKVMVSV